MSLRRSVRLGVAVVLGSGLVVLVNPSPAFAADTTRPALTVQPALFFQGGQIGPSDPASSDPDAMPPVWTSQIPMYVTWSGSDASDICGYDVWDENGSEEYQLVRSTLRTRYDGDTTDYDGSVGAGATVTYAWKIVAHDCAGNTTAKERGVLPEVIQEDGTDLYGNPSPIRIAYTGTWGTSYCTCWSHGAVRRTTQKGATATVNFSTGTANSPIALVMEKAPGRGKFTVLLDGVNKGTIDTYSAVASHRVIVWSGKAVTAGKHVVKIVNQATAGRSRIDLDAVLTNG